MCVFVATNKWRSDQCVQSILVFDSIYWWIRFHDIPYTQYALWLLWWYREFESKSKKKGKRGMVRQPLSRMENVTKRLNNDAKYACGERQKEKRNSDSVCVRVDGAVHICQGPQPTHYLLRLWKHAQSILCTIPWYGNTQDIFSQFLLSPSSFGKEHRAPSTQYTQFVERKYAISYSILFVYGARLWVVGADASSMISFSNRIRRNNDHIIASICINSKAMRWASHLPRASSAKCVLCIVFRNFHVVCATDWLTDYDANANEIHYNKAHNRGIQQCFISLSLCCSAPSTFQFSWISIQDNVICFYCSSSFRATSFRCALQHGIVWPLRLLAHSSSWKLEKP